MSQDTKKEDPIGIWFFVVLGCLSTLAFGLGAWYAWKNSAKRNATFLRGIRKTTGITTTSEPVALQDLDQSAGAGQPMGLGRSQSNHQVRIAGGAAVSHGWDAAVQERSGPAASAPSNTITEATDQTPATAGDGETNKPVHDEAATVSDQAERDEAKADAETETEAETEENLEPVTVPHLGSPESQVDLESVIRSGDVARANRKFG